MAENPVVYKQLEPLQIAAIKKRIESREEIPALLEQVRQACGEAIAGEAIAIFHGGAVKEGFIVEAGYPVRSTVEEGEVHTRTLEAARAATMLHYGVHQSMRETVQKIYETLEKRAWTTSLWRREIYRSLDADEPEKNVTEVQAILHEWERLFGEAAEESLGKEASRELMQGAEKIGPEMSFEDYTAWIRGAIERLDELTDEGQVKCLVVSRCAHVFPQERIEQLRAIYERGEIDDVLYEMYQDDYWYERPRRKGNVIYMRKNPYEPEGYEKATTPAERRKAYCHCPFVHPYLDEIPAKLSQTFCYCGAGWYRRLWEGILGAPVRIEHVETLLRGNDQCTLTITLPLELEGECEPK